MADDRMLRGAADRTRINIHEDYEVRYWTQKWSVTREQLVAAVEAAGTNDRAAEQALELLAESGLLVVRGERQGFRGENDAYRQGHGQCSQGSVKMILTAHSQRRRCRSCC